VRPRGFSLLVLDETDSTNDEAARQLAAGRAVPFAVIARRQTRGRGRLGRTWHSAANGNLYLSVAFRRTFRRTGWGRSRCGWDSTSANCSPTSRRFRPA